LQEPATQAAYWGMVAAIVDPDAAARNQSGRLAQMVFGLAPALKPRVESMLADTRPAAGDAAKSTPQAHQ